MVWRSLPLDIEQSTEDPKRLRISCRFCEMVWTGLVEIKDALDHVTTLHPDKPWCGHRNYANGHCAELGCNNYYMRHWNRDGRT